MTNPFLFFSCVLQFIKNSSVRTDFSPLCTFEFIRRASSLQTTRTRKKEFPSGIPHPRGSAAPIPYLYPCADPSLIPKILFSKALWPKSPPQKKNLSRSACQFFWNSQLRRPLLCTAQQQELPPQAMPGERTCSSIRLRAVIRLCILHEMKLVRRPHILAL